ncbi:two-component system sensor histidine kinase MtrB [Stackebrandtia albiflava]|uniref:Sensor histidine kinase MtrB n=1 Tax=Stackebrandtia albiflava TaxID=406432 RepID=A0A562V4U5_9ACTN|nr:MtrAB system histidine kinase MtrB [Stackebrandtia albiflava]TWJ12837.1 two-component system sensor histidine kinase MtrB [Stackebrandtia albiflava]
MTGRDVVEGMARATGRIVRFARRLAAPVLRAWRGSMQVRVVSATLVASTVLVVVFSLVVASTIIGGMVDTKVDGSVDQVERAGDVVRDALDTVVTAEEPNLGGQMGGLVRELAGEEDQVGQPTVLLRIRGANPIGEAWPAEASVTEAQLPEELTDNVRDGKFNRQFATLNPDGEGNRPFLAVGTPVYTDQLVYELYFLFPLDAENQIASLVRTTLVIAGVALVLLLGVIAGLVTRMVVTPVRLAARTAQRLSAGLLHERMTVKGADDLARLAGSFNLMAENLHQQILRLEDMSRLQRRFTSDVSHELRTPLTTVRMAADLLYDNREDYPAPAARSAELLHDELDRFEDLLAELLEISRFDAGFAQLDTEPVEVGPIVTSVSASFHALAERCGVPVRLHIPDTPLIAEIDVRRVQRILRNLIGNAIEHAEAAPVCVVLASSETSLAVVVRDRGIGLKPGEEELVFNRFWRADPSRARQTGGTGLGLSISSEDAKLHNGQLEAVGRPGEGSVFRLTLPLRSGDKVLSSPLPLDFAADPCGGDDDDQTE